MKDKEYSRIDLIGQNGATGEHYNYPTQVCFDCGIEAMSLAEGINDTYLWHVGECQVCKVRGIEVTSPFFFGCPSFGEEENE